MSATAAQPTSVKALALAVLARNQQRNSTATTPEKERNFEESNTGQKLRSVARPQSHDIAVPTEPETDDDVRIVQEKLLAGESVRMKMGDIGEAYWVATETQRDELVAELTANSDNTPVYCWGELVRVSGWSHSNELIVYQANRLLQATVEPVDADPATAE